MSPHHRQKGDPCPPRDSSCTLLVAGVVLFVLGVLFFASVNCAQTWRGVTICGFGDPYSWREDPGLGFMVWGSWSGVHGLGFMVWLQEASWWFVGAVLKGKNRSTASGEGEAPSEDG